MLMTEDPTHPGLYIVAMGVRGVSGGYQSQEWAASGANSLYVPDGKTATATLASYSTVLTVARYSGQELTVGGAVVASAAAGETIRATGATSAVFGPGWWDNLLIVEGDYTGPYFDGNSLDEDGFTFAWTDVENDSTSIQQGTA